MIRHSQLKTFNHYRGEIFCLKNGIHQKYTLNNFSKYKNDKPKQLNKKYDTQLEYYETGSHAK